MTDIQAKAAAFNIISEGNSIPPEDRQLAGRFGALLLIGLCMPTPDSHSDVVGRMLSILFNWFRITAYTYDSKFRIQITIEKKKNRFIVRVRSSFILRRSRRVQSGTLEKIYHR